jgi:hypothetical protein
MAIRNVNEGVSNWNNGMPFPQDNYELTCVEEDFGASKASGNPMITRKWEIVKPETAVLGDKQVSIAGQQITEYIVCKNKNADGEGWDTKKSDESFGKLRDDLLLLGHDKSEGIDDENPPTIAKGKTVLAWVYAKEQPRLKAPTPEQLAKGQKQGDPVKIDGKEVKRYELKLGEKYKLVSGGSGF